MMDIKLHGRALRVAMALALPLVSLSGQATEHWYAGAKAGWTNGSAGCDEQASACGNDNIGGGVFVGYQVNDWLALEAGYDYLGTITADYPALENPNASAHYQSEMQGFEFVAKPFWQIGADFSLFAKVGLLAWDVDVTGNEVSFEHTASNDGWSPLLGTGIEYAFSRNWSTSLEYQWANNVGGGTTGGTDLNMLNLGVTYHFISESNVPPVSAPDTNITE